MMERCRARSGAAPPIKATVGPTCGSAESLTAALLPLMRSAAWWVAAPLASLGGDDAAAIARTIAALGGAHA